MLLISFACIKKSSIPPNGLQGGKVDSFMCLEFVIALLLLNGFMHKTTTPYAKLLAIKLRNIINTLC